MTGEHAEAQAEHTAEAVGLESLSERERVIGVRFFVAARADSPEAARNILTENLKPTDKKVRIEGVYNPVLEGISIAERKDYWQKEGSAYEEALGKWRNRFTTVVNQVTDETRIAAFKSILPDDPTLKDKALNEINHDDATTLFREYSENKSDIDKFMGRAITNLTTQGVLEPAALQAHITHLRWIATGFFGKETASMIGTQILLEVERKKDLSVAGRSVVNEFIDNNLERVNNLKPEEAEILRVVRQQAVLWEEEKKKQPVDPTPAVQPAQPIIGVTADDDELFPGPVAPQSNNPTRPPVAGRARAEESDAPVAQTGADANQDGTLNPIEQSASRIVASRLKRLTSSIKKGVSKRVLLPASILSVALFPSDNIQNPNMNTPNIKEPTPASAPLPDFTRRNIHVLQPYTPQAPTSSPPSLTPEATKTPIPTPTPTPKSIEIPTQTPVPTKPPEATQVPVKLPSPTIEATKAPPKPKEEENKWTGRKWSPNETVSVREWWNDMVVKGYINIDAIAQQYGGGEIENFLASANLVPNPVKYYETGYGFLGTCKDKLDGLVRQGQGHITITSKAYAQIPGANDCFVVTNKK